jgi:hypothetical protein
MAGDFYEGDTTMKVYKLLADEARWTRDKLSRNIDGDGVWPLEEEAVSWCVAGAIMKCYPHDTIGETIERLHQYLKTNLNYDLVSFWNDAPERTHDEVISVLRELDI